MKLLTEISLKHGKGYNLTTLGHWVMGLCPCMPPEATYDRNYVEGVCQKHLKLNIPINKPQEL